MPSTSPFITHTFGGGWATDFGQTYYGPPQDQRIEMPFLVDAINCFYELDGGPHKVGGTAKYNSSSLGASVGFLGLYDYFRSGTSGSTTQKRIAYTNEGVIYKDDIDGTWDSLATGLSTTAAPSFETFDDILIISNDSGTDVPRSWDQTTFQNLAGSPPTFSFCVAHKNKVFAAGVPTLPSRLYYCIDNDPENWTGAGSGSIDIDPDDGDRIVGLVAHKGDLWVFKGPHKGSIHRITGSSPTGSDAFARIPFIRGITCAYHNLIFRFGDDIGFMSPWGTVHSLNATANYGDYGQSFLSFPIDSYVRTYLAHNRLKQGWAVNDPTRGVVLFTIPGVSQTNNTQVLMMDYRFGPSSPRWAQWPAFSWGAIALMTDTLNRKRLFAGGYTGYVWKCDQDSRTNDGSGLNMTVTTPYFTYGSELMTKTLTAVSLGVVPANSNSIGFNWTRDNNTQQTSTTMTQGGGGATFGTSTFGPSTTFAGGRFSPRFLEMHEGGEFRSISYQFQDTANNSDLEVHNLGAKIVLGSESLEN